MAVTTVTTAWVAELQDLLGADGVLTDPDVTASYARDQAMLAESGTPAAVVFPRSTADVVAVMQTASRYGVPVVPRGAGSGLVGASNAVDGGITLVTTRMDAVLEVSPADRLAVVQPGVVNKQLRDAVAGAGLFYPPDPASYDWCTIGGNLAMNSGGLCCVKYGVTTDSTTWPVCALVGKLATRVTGDACGAGRSARVASVITPRVPSEPTNSRARS